MAAVRRWYRLRRARAAYTRQAWQAEHRANRRLQRAIAELAALDSWERSIRF